MRFRDLRNGPAILLGGLNNQWTMSFAEHLRFAFKSKERSTKTWIRDQESYPRGSFGFTTLRPLLAITEDHAIVARLLESATGQPIVIAGGHTAYGTAAAGEFVTNASFSNQQYGGRDGRLEFEQFGICDCNQCGSWGFRAATNQCCSLW